MAKKRPYEKKAFESTGEPADVSANLYLSMLTSPAWRELTARQQILYLYCKAQYYAEKKKPVKDNPLSFSMNQAKWREQYGLYKVNDEKSFYRDMSELILKGFVSCLMSGANTRQKSIYAFSIKWQKYGTPDFEILPSEMTAAMLKKFIKK